MKYQKALAFPTLLAWLGASAPAGAADGTVPIDHGLIAGNRVRLHSSAYSRPLTGRVQSVDEDSVVLAVDDAMVVRVPAGSLERVRVSTARKRRTLRGALIGAVAGVPMGLSYEVDRYACDSWGSYAFCNRGEAIAAGVLGGAALGALVGRFVKTDEWAEVRLPRVTVAPTRGGTQVGLAWSFGAARSGHRHGARP